MSRASKLLEIDKAVVIFDKNLKRYSDSIKDLEQALKKAKVKFKWLPSTRRRGECAMETSDLDRVIEIAKQYKIKYIEE